MSIGVVVVAIPKTTLATAPYTVVAEFFRPILAGGRVKFPDRCAGQVGLIIRDGGQQLVPATPGTWLVGNNEVIQFDGPFILEGPPYRLNLLGYNLDQTFPHTLQVALEFG